MLTAGAVTLVVAIALFSARKTSTKKKVERTSAHAAASSSAKKEEPAPTPSRAAAPSSARKEEPAPLSADTPPSAEVMKLVGGAPGDVKALIAAKSMELRRLRAINAPWLDRAVGALQREIEEIKAASLLVKNLKGEITIKVKQLRVAQRASKAALEAEIAVLKERFSSLTGRAYQRGTIVTSGATAAEEPGDGDVCIVENNTVLLVLSDGAAEDLAEAFCGIVITNLSKLPSVRK